MYVPNQLHSSKLAVAISNGYNLLHCANMHAVANCYYIFMNMHIHMCFIACSFLFVLRTLFVIIYIL